MAQLVSSASSTHPFPSPDASLIDTAVAAFTGKSGSALGLEVYDHHGPFLFPKWSFASDQAPLILRQKRRRASTARGEGGCADLAPGHRFTLENHPGAHLNRIYVVTSVEHRGEARSQGGEWRVYRVRSSDAQVGESAEGLLRPQPGGTTLTLESNSRRGALAGLTGPRQWYPPVPRRMFWTARNFPCEPP